MLLIDALGLGDSLANLYAASVDARSLGLRARDFSLAATRSNPHICNACKGLGVTLQFFDELPRPLAAPCQVCHGLRCKSPVRDILFRGTSFSRMLNQNFDEAFVTLKALPKAARTLKLIEMFELQKLPLGMPLTLLSDSEQRAVLLAQALLRATRARPSIVLIEEPEMHLSRQQRCAIEEVCSNWPEGALVSRIEVSG
jgi:excinuclease ABC subunit A